jgi:peptide/nickel transport system substrate-binding protein
MSPLKNITEKLVIVVLVIFSLLSGGALFFEDQFTAFTSLLSSDGKVTVDNSGRVLKLAYLFTPKDLNPFSSDSSTQSRLNDVYQSLVVLDANFKIEPSLAVYYGLSGNTDWTMHIREGVKFHDGSDLDANDVIYSFDQAKKLQGYAAELVDSVQKLEKIDQHTVIFTTKNSDPLFLNKLANLMIVPDQWTPANKPAGTGPYRIDDFSDLADIFYSRNDQYWDKLPYFEKLEIKAVEDKGERIAGLIDKSIDFLVNVPPDNAKTLIDDGFTVDMVPSLEVGFIMFDLNDVQFSKKPLRKAVALALNKTGFLELAFGYAKTVNQFVSNGVFGYNPDIKGFEFDLTAAEKALTEIDAGFEKISVQVFYPESLRLMGQFIRDQLRDLGMDVELMPMNDQKLLEGINRGVLPIYYLGWRNERGDALPFLKDVLHSKTDTGYGKYNGMNYVNQDVDRLIEDAQSNLNVKQRLKDMQEVMKIAVEDDIVGVPLFETYSLFAYSPDLFFTPRVDSQIYPSTISIK